MTWQRHSQTSTRRTWYTSVCGRYMIQCANSGWYECWHGSEYLGGSGMLGGAKNLCEMHAKGGK